jgi:hypothetical protein
VFDATLLDISELMSEEEWAANTMSCIHGSTRIVKKGRSPGSLEPEETAGLDYWVTNGQVVKSVAPGFIELYKNPELISCLEEVVGAKLELVPDETSRATVNVLPAGKRYEEHVDDWGITAVVFLTSCSGGQLEVQEGGEWVGFQPRPGRLAIMDGSRVPHRVAVVEKGIRVTLLFEYLIQGRKETRSTTLNSELYGLPE